MTTEIVRYSSPDSYVKNDVFVLPESSRVPNVEVGAVGWITGSAGGVRAGHHECFHAVGAHVNQNIPDHRMWLLACHSAWQADNRIIRHRKLWSSLQARGLTIPDGRQIDERMQVGRDGIRWYGAVEVAIEELAYAADIVDEEPSSYVVSLSRLGESELSNLIESGWDRVDVGPSPDVLRKIVSADGIVLWPVGAFDESEVGVVAFTQPNILRRLAVL